MKRNKKQDHSGGRFFPFEGALALSGDGDVQFDDDDDDDDFKFLTARFREYTARGLKRRLHQ